MLRSSGTIDVGQLLLPVPFLIPHIYCLRLLSHFPYGISQPGMEIESQLFSFLQYPNITISFLF